MLAVDGAPWRSIVHDLFLTEPARRYTLGLRLPGHHMVTRVSTVAFEGIEGREVDVQVQISAGNVAFVLVGLPDKAVGESKERVRAALLASGLALPAKRITVNLAPADLPKEGSHYDLPIALGIMAAIGAIPSDALSGYTVLGELALDGSITAVAGVLPAAIAANGRGHGLICPAACGPEAAWSSPDADILAPRSLIQLANHFKGDQVLARPEPAVAPSSGPLPDLRDIRGQESAKRTLEIAAAGGHNLLMSGPPGAGKSMLAARLPSILPPLRPQELLEISMVQSVAGLLADGALSSRRPFRAPHHSASMAALVGGGVNAKPGEISLAHHGVLFLDELPEFQPGVLDALSSGLRARCAVSGCHSSRDASGGAATPAQGLDFGQPAAVLAALLTTRPARGSLEGLLLVQPGLPEQSYLLRKLIAGSGFARISGEPMPPTGLPALNPDRLRAVELWIRQGAK